MQDSLSYKINCVINNWFDSTYADLDFDGFATGITIDTFYCTGCATRKDITLHTRYKDASNRTRYKCKSCATKTH